LLTVVIPWCDRPAISDTLRLNRPLIGEHELIVVNVGGDRDILMRAVNDADLADIRVVHLTGTAFNKSFALNVGLHLASHDACMMLDADIRLCEYDFVAAVEKVDDGAFVTLDRVVAEKDQVGLGRSGLAAVRHRVALDFADGRTIEVETSALFNDGNARSGPGILLASTSRLREIGGYNSAFIGWGWEDVDVIVRLQQHGLRRESHGLGWHLSGSDAAAEPSGTTKRDSELRNRALAFRNYAAGQFLGTLENDVRRCFGTGL